MKTLDNFVSSFLIVDKLDSFKALYRWVVPTNSGVLKTIFNYIPTNFFCSFFG